MKIYKSPYVIGYWARVRQCPDADVFADGTLGPLVESVEDRAEYRRGWADADEEIRAERVAALMADLGEAYESGSED